MCSLEPAHDPLLVASQAEEWLQPVKIHFFVALQVKPQTLIY